MQTSKQSGLYGQENLVAQSCLTETQCAEIFPATNPDLLQFFGLNKKLAIYPFLKYMIQRNMLVKYEPDASPEPHNGNPPFDQSTWVQESSAVFLDSNKESLENTKSVIRSQFLRQLEEKMLVGEKSDFPGIISPILGDSVPSFCSLDLKSDDSFDSFFQMAAKVYCRFSKMGFDIGFDGDLPRIIVLYDSKSDVYDKECFLREHLLKSFGLRFFHRFSTTTDFLDPKKAYAMILDPVGAGRFQLDNELLWRTYPGTKNSFPNHFELKLFSGLSYKRGAVKEPRTLAIDLVT